MSSKSSNPKPPSSTASTTSTSTPINLYLKPSSQPNIPNPLPNLIQTPSGLALLELQGRINTPDSNSTTSTATSNITELGNISFPDYDPKKDPSDTAWMKKVYMFIGKHQRLSGEVKKLPVPLGAVGRRTTRKDDGEDVAEEGDENDLEVVEVVKYKILFSQRPEPVTDSLYS